MEETLPENEERIKYERNPRGAGRLLGRKSENALWIIGPPMPWTFLEKSPPKGCRNPPTRFWNPPKGFWTMPKEF